MKLSWRFSFVSLPLLSLLIPNMGYSQCQTQSSAANLSELNSPTSEVALANMIIYSQEYMRYFFSDNESEIQPLPASGLALFTGYGLSGSSRWLNALSLPLREEEVKKKNGDTFQYYYPKIFMTGYEIDALERPFFSHATCLRVSVSAGISLFLSRRALKDIPPFLLSRTSVRIAPNVDLNFGIGYSGNIKMGAWFFPFGVSYQLKFSDRGG